MPTIFAEEQTHRPVQHSPRDFTRSERLQQLERIISSSHFRNSKRYPAFLRYVVEHTVEQDNEILKERNLGIEIFGRASDYDTNADPIVRVTAGEVRKRIAQYYQTTGHENELRIDLPLGSYVPHFYASHHAPAIYLEPDLIDHVILSEPLAQPIPEAAAVSVAITAKAPAAGLREQLRLRPGVTKLLLISALALLAVGAPILAGLVRQRSKEAGTRYFWQPFTSSNKSILVVMGVHTLGKTGIATAADAHSKRSGQPGQSALSMMENSNMIPLSDLVSYSKMTDLLTRDKLEYRTEGSEDATLDELRAGPVILFGGFDNLWTLRLTSALRYRLVSRGSNLNGIEDSQDPSKIWVFDNLQPALTNARDYAIVASYYDTTIEQHVVIAAGIGKNGTITASEFLTTDAYLQNWLKEAKIPANKNIELVLSTDVLDGEAGPPHILAYTSW